LRTLAQACAVTVCFAVLLVATSPRMAMVWDEGDTIVRAERIEWFGARRDAPQRRPSPLAGEGGERSEPGEGARARRDDDLARDRPLTRSRHAGTALSREGRGNENRPWPYTITREGHPPLAGIAIALGMRVAPHWLDPLTWARFGPMLLFSLAAGAMFYRLQRDYGAPVVSWTAVAVLATMPRVFAHAHYATLDGPLTACWILCWAAFASAARDWRYIPVFALALGLTLSAKFTGWLAPLPFMVWTILYRNRGAAVALTVALPLALAVFYLLNPPLWDDKVFGLIKFFDLNLHRAARPQHNVSTLFFGRMYNLDYPLPWYNTLAWTAITISPLVLLLGAIGIGSSLRHWRGDAAGVLLVCQWATLIVVRALPWAPPHDAERLILPSFAFFAALVGVGIGRCLFGKTLTLPERNPPRRWAKVLLAIALAAAAFDSIRYFPYNLSYYSPLSGGLRGAVALGMEPTYYWDSLDREMLKWLNENTAADEKIVLAAYPPRNLELLRRWGQLEPLPDAPARFRWYVVQRRPSAWRPYDKWLIEHAQSAIQSKLFGVPLLDVYHYEQYEQAVAATR
jgi:4-amino-4-deoxy-L-arabinose transferase-like glycosyltransferase